MYIQSCRISAFPKCSKNQLLKYLSVCSLFQFVAGLKGGMGIMLGKFLS